MEYNKHKGPNFIYKIVIMSIIFLNVLDIFNHKFLPLIDYNIYNMNIEQYTMVNAKVIDKQEKSLIKGRTVPLVSIIETRIEYEIDGKVYNKSLFTYPEKEIFDEIMVAVDGEKIRRCMPFKISILELLDESLILIVFFIIFILLCWNEKPYKNKV